MINIALLTSDLDLDLTEKIVSHFHNYPDAQISCVISNIKNSKTKKILRRYKRNFFETDRYKEIDDILTKTKSHYIIMSGYSEKIPPNFSKKYEWRIINLIKSENKITILFEKNIYDDANIIFEKEIEINDEKYIKSDIDNIAINFYPTLIEKIIRNTYKKLFK